MDSVAGCLASHQDGWIDINAEEWVLAVLRVGYRIPFSSLPLMSKTPSFWDVLSWFRKGQGITVGDPASLDKGEIETAPTPGFYSHLFVIPKSSGGYRPIWDLSVINRYVHTTKFRMETVRTIMSAVWLDN